MAIIEVVKYDGKENVFAWKYPNNELGTWTQLIVNEAQEAVLFSGGQAFDVFTAGRHTLDTLNIPFLNKIINLPFGGRSPFTAEVWFVNKAYSMDVKWGTPTPIQLQDPKYNIFLQVRSYGQFAVNIIDSKKFLIKLVGTLQEFNRENLHNYFRGLYVTKAKDAISSYIIKKRISLLEINSYLEELSDHISEKIAPTFYEYGIGISNFYVNDINIPEDDSSVIKLREALAKKAEMDIVGYNYSQERSFDTLEGAAKNTGAGSSALLGAGLGLGMGVGMGGNMGNAFGNMAKNINMLETRKCKKCGTEIDINKPFCFNCGSPMYETEEKQTSKESSDTGNTKKTIMIKCSNCGHEYALGSKFCPECGDKYNACPFCKADIQSGASICHSCKAHIPYPCTKCGFHIESSKMKFCPECGNSLKTISDDQK